MKKILLLAMSALALAGCSKPKELSPQEAWQKFCSVIPSAANNIMTDRQQGIKEEDALKHAQQVPDKHAQEYLESLIKEAYKLPIYQNMAARQKAMDDFSKGRDQECLKQTAENK
ncbi:lipoprotein [Acinetobacter sp. MB5]|uniref:lipoprotein n=1 Tax=Acinetobacter sp. MB5 TaxID=2069438 RepID=UPI000DD00E78|nr:lipoprotein [Acinetobacter sp. MB5]